MTAWQADSKEQTLDHGLHKEKIVSLAWTKDDTGVASISYDLSMAVHNLATKKNF